MRCLIFERVFPVIFVLAICSIGTVADDSKSPALRPDWQSQVEWLEKSIRSSGSFDEAGKLISLAERLDQQTNPKHRAEAGRIGRNLFLSSAPHEVRTVAFQLYRRHYPHEIGRHVTKINLIVPGISCYGRFGDSLRENVVNKHDWIWDVSVVNSGENEFTNKAASAAGLAIGSDAIVTFTVNNAKTPADLRSAIQHSKAYDLNSWQLLVAQPFVEAESSSHSPK